MSENEQNKTEEATAFKLKKAREKGQVAKGADLGFASTLIGAFLFALVAGQNLVQQITNSMQRVYVSSIAQADEIATIYVAISSIYSPAAKLLALLGGTVTLVVIFFEIIQVKGLYFTLHPLKPDFNKLNPARGLKRIFSARTLLDTLKSLLKLSVYTGCTYFVILYAVSALAPVMGDANRVIDSMRRGGSHLIMMFAVMALGFVVLDQIISRRAFKKQMRMSRSEVTRENKDREGEPRIKQKRRQLHADFIKQTEGAGNLPGSDLLIVNPQHFAVALRYIPGEMSAPQVTAKGRNRFALSLKKQAFGLSIPILEDPPLARALFRSTDPGQLIQQQHFRAVADKYLALHLRRALHTGKSE